VIEAAAMVTPGERLSVSKHDSDTAFTNALMPRVDYIVPQQQTFQHVVQGPQDYHRRQLLELFNAMPKNRGMKLFATYAGLGNFKGRCSVPSSWAHNPA